MRYLIALAGLLATATGVLAQGCYGVPPYGYGGTSFQAPPFPSFAPPFPGTFQGGGQGRFELRGEADLSIRVPLRVQRDFQFGGGPAALPFYPQTPTTFPTYSPYDTGAYSFLTGPGGQTAGWTTGPGGTQIYGPQGGYASINPFGVYAQGPYGGSLGVNPYGGYAQGPYGGGVGWQRPQTFQAAPGLPIVSEQRGTCP